MQTTPAKIWKLKSTGVNAPATIPHGSFKILWSQLINSDDDKGMIACIRFVDGKPVQTYFGDNAPRYELR